MAKLAVVISSTRPVRVGPTIAAWFVEQVQRHGEFDVGVVDLSGRLPLLDEPQEASSGQYQHEHTKQWSATVRAYDAFVFVTPEYNRGISAPLKNALDYLYDEWAYKAVGFVSYGMSSAGLRAVEMAKQIVTTLRMVPVVEVVSEPLRQRLDAAGALHADAAMATTATEMLDELSRLTRALSVLQQPAELIAR